MLICGIVMGGVIGIFRLREVPWHEKELKIRQLVETGFSVLTHFHALQQKNANSPRQLSRRQQTDDNIYKK
jgi:RNA polymerase-interacting CarD/CdnL/TRCF family regulator